MNLLKLLVLTLFLLISNVSYTMMRSMMPTALRAVKHSARHMNVLSFNPHVYAALDEKSKIQPYRLQLKYGEKIERAHWAMFAALKESGDERDGALKFVFDDGNVIGTAIKHKMRPPYQCVHPTEIAALISILENGYNTLVCHDENGGAIYESHAWNFPYHRLIDAITLYNRNADSAEARLPIISSYALRLCSVRIGGRVARVLRAKSALQASLIYEDLCENYEREQRLFYQKVSKESA